MNHSNAFTILCSIFLHVVWRINNFRFIQSDLLYTWDGLRLVHVSPPTSRLQAVQQEKKRAEGLFLHFMGANSSITNKNRDLTNEQRTHTGINSIDLQ